MVSHFLGEQKREGQERRREEVEEEEEEEKKRYGSLVFFVWKSRFLYGFYDVWKKLLVLILSNNMYTFPPV